MDRPRKNKRSKRANEKSNGSERPLDQQLSVGSLKEFEEKTETVREKDRKRELTKRICISGRYTKRQVVFPSLLQTQKRAANNDGRRNGLQNQELWKAEKLRHQIKEEKTGREGRTETKKGREERRKE